MESVINQTLVVGASGRVGRLLARAWAISGERPVLQHRGADLNWAGPQLVWHPVDGMPLPQGFRAMIVLAGVVSGDLEQNARIARACFQAAQRAGIAQVLFTSSSAVYGSNGGLPCREDTPLQPVNGYGRAKLEAEAVATEFPDLAITALRIGNVAGADALLTNPSRPLRIDRFASGHGPLRSYIGPQALARVCQTLVGQKLPRLLNLASAPIRMEALAEAAQLPWTFQPAPVTAHEAITLDTTLLAALLPLRAQTASEIAADWQACQ
jgi:UDP-glucose 4-epimerase